MKRELHCKSRVARLIERNILDVFDMGLGPVASEREIKHRLDILMKRGEIYHFHTVREQRRIDIRTWHGNGNAVQTILFTAEDD